MGHVGPNFNLKKKPNKQTKQNEKGNEKFIMAEHPTSELF